MVFSFFKKQIKESQKYLGLFLKEQGGVLMIIEENNDQMILKEKRNFAYSNGWENLTDDVNESLALLKTEEQELNHLIIFVYSHLVDQNTKEIKKPILLSIKKMVNHLNFQPLGYIEAGDALANFLQEKDNLPLTAILVEIDKTELSVFIYKGNQIILKKIVSRSSNFIDDLMTIFGEKKQEFLPARIILYNSTDLDQKAESIISFRWPESYFLQIPKVNIVKEEELIEALLKIFEEQIKERKKESFLPESKKEKKEVLGFVIGEDISFLEQKKQEKTDVILEKKNFHFTLPKIVFPKINWPLFSFLKFKDIKLPIILFSIFAIFLTMIINELFFHRLQLTIYPTTSSIKKEINLVGVINQKELNDKLNISSQSSTVEISLDKKTTGERKVGDKARGEITIYNSNLDAAESIAKGTTVLSDNGLKFVIEEDVKVASASGDASNPKPSTAKVKVTAFDIGEEYNLSAGQKFKIEGKSANLLAKNEVSFSGGTKRTVKTVSRNDTEELRNKAIEQIKSKPVNLNSDKKLINNLTEINLLKEQYSKEIGEEAETLELKANGEKNYYFYDINQLKDRLLSILKKETPKELVIEKNQISAELIGVEKKDNQINLKFKTNVLLIKKIDIDSLKKQMIFVSKKQMADVLKDKFQINRYDFKLNSGLLFFERTPIFPKNIEIIIKY
jgi:hypothetical protein